MTMPLDQDTRWIASVALLVPAHLAGAAALIGASLSGNDADADAGAFYARRLRTIGSEAVTHRLAHTRMRGVVLALLPDLEAELPGCVWWITRWDRDDPPPRPVASVEAELARRGLAWADQDKDEDG